MKGAAEMGQSSTLRVDIDSLRAAIRAEYAAVAEYPAQGFHFHTGARLAAILGYQEEWLAELPASAIESMAGTGNPFALGELQQGLVAHRTGEVQVQVGLREGTKVPPSLVGRG